MSSPGAFSPDEVAALLFRAMAPVTDLVVVADTSLVVRFASEGARGLGYDPSDLLGRSGLDFVHPDELGMFASVALIMAQGQDPNGLGLYRLQRADGSYQVMEVNAGRFPLRGEMAGFWFLARRPRRSEIYTATLHAVLEDRPLSEALGTIPELLPAIGERFCITGSVEGGPTFTVGDRLPPALNGSDRRPGSPWDLAARSGSDFIADHLDDLDVETAELARREELGGLAVVPVAGVDGTTTALITIWVPTRMTTAETLNRTLGVRELVAAAIRIRAQVESLRKTARSDALTGLANRRAFDDSLESDAQQKASVVCYIDLDGFKEVNDTHGHQVGDRLLCEVSDRIRASVRGADVVARLGGDEFAVLSRNCIPSEAAEMSERILDALRRPLSIDGLDLSVTASIGVATGQPGSRDLLQRADAALYEAKRAGRDTARFSER
jgi:diguanylate cyclase (GGDEF)-like protein/PAS domain S-box-containing protein